MNRIWNQNSPVLLPSIPETGNRRFWEPMVPEPVNLDGVGLADLESLGSGKGECVLGPDLPYLSLSVFSSPMSEPSNGSVNKEQCLPVDVPMRLQVCLWSSEVRWNYLDGLECMDLDILFFFSKNVNTEMNEISCITLVRCNQINFMEWCSEWKYSWNGNIFWNENSHV